MKQRQKKEAVINAVQASDNRFSRERAHQDPSLVAIMRGRHPNGKPTITIIARWAEAEPTLELKRLFRMLLSRPQGGRDDK